MTFWFIARAHFIYVFSSTVEPRISLVIFNIFTFLFFYLILHGQMHVISVTWKYPTFWLVLQMQILIRCLPRTCRFQSFSSYWPIETHGMNQNYDWVTHNSLYQEKNENIREIPEIYAIEPKIRENKASMTVSDEPRGRNRWSKNVSVEKKMAFLFDKYLLFEKFLVFAWNWKNDTNRLNLRKQEHSLAPPSDRNRTN